MQGPGAFVSRADEHIIVPNNWRGCGGAGQRQDPFHILRFREFSRQILFRARAIEIWATPMRPIFGVNWENEQCEGERKKQFCHWDHLPNNLERMAAVWQLNDA